jgi:hypothetical protein
MLYYGVSTGFANYIPILALVGSFILFVIAAPVLVYKYKVGLTIGIIGCLFMLPYSIMFLKGVFDDGVFNWVLLLSIVPFLLIGTGAYLSSKTLLQNNEPIRGIMIAGTYKLLLSGMPILLFVLYLIFYGKYWSWDMFKL